jgi:predicted metal-dependent hydrolase
MFALDNIKYGDTLPFKGVNVTVKYASKTHFDGENFYINPGKKSVTDVVIGLYKSLARRDLTRRMVELARLMNVVPVSVKITSAVTRWGSCSAERSISFSWRLILADNAAIDYVIIHELAHLTELNHSDRFWAIVKTYCPDCKSCKARLKALAEWLSG